MKWNWGFQGKTFWDFMLLVLLPLLIAGVGWRFQVFQQDVADERYREEAIQTYYKEMSELILEKKLPISNSRDEVQSIARARTLSVLKRLDPQRQGFVALFLKESGLITLEQNDKRELKRDDKGDLISQKGKVSMSGADLMNADLKAMDLSYVSFWYAGLAEAQLERADLRYANLSKANLEGANLNGANLGSATLKDAKMTNATMKGAKFCKTIMSDGSVNNADCVANSSLLP